MAKDERLWMRFPIDFHRDPKLTRLTDRQFRTFVEMNGEARLEGNDGVFTKDDAEFRWDAGDLAGLVASHPTEPLVVFADDCYRLRRYARHQFTEADREELAQKRAEAGAAGGRKSGESRRKRAEASRSNGEALASRIEATRSNTKQTEPESESESESEIDDYSNTGSVSPVSDRARNAGLTDRGITSIINTVNLHCDIDATETEAVELAEHITSKAKTAPRSVPAYVRNAIENGPSEIDAWFRARRRHLKAVGQ